eukprot:54745-Prorocentrum_lima.AAC.1
MRGALRTHPDWLAGLDAPGTPVLLTPCRSSGLGGAFGVVCLSGRVGAEALQPDAVAPGFKSGCSLL